MAKKPHMTYGEFLTALRKHAPNLHCYMSSNRNIRCKIPGSPWGLSSGPVAAVRHYIHWSYRLQSEKEAADKLGLMPQTFKRLVRAIENKGAPKTRRDILRALHLKEAA